VEFGEGTQADIKVAYGESHSGNCSVRISDQSPTQAYIYALFQSPFLEVSPRMTYLITILSQGKKHR